MCKCIRPPPTSDNPLFRCADGDMQIFGTLILKSNHKCTHGCGGYISCDSCGVQEKNKSYLNKIALMTHMCYKCAANIGKTELMYKPPIDVEYEESNFKEEEDMDDRTSHSLHLNIRSKSPSPVHNKQRNSYVGGKKPKTPSTSKVTSKTSLTLKMSSTSNTFSKSNTVN